MESIIELKTAWLPEDSTCQTCEVCAEVIYGTTYRLWAGRYATEACLCESCFGLLEKQ